MLRAVLFDMGGTLLEYRHENWSELDNELNRDLHEYIAARGHADRLPPLDEFLEVMNRRTRRHWHEMARQQQGASLLLLLDQLFKEHGIQDLQTQDCLLPWYRGVREMTYVRPDVKPTLERLQTSGLKLGMVSNTAWPSGAHDPDLERFGLIDLLPCRVYSCEVGWEKPAPPIFHAALSCTGIPAEETAFVGDFRRYDIAGAHAVGMKGIWKRIEGRPDSADDATVTPDAVIATIGELPEALTMLYNWAG